MNAPDPVAAALARLNLPDPRAGTRPAGGVVSTMNLKVLPDAHLEALIAVAVIELEERRARKAQPGGAPLGEQEPSA